MYEIKNIEQVEKILEENNIKIKDEWIFHNFWRKVDIKDNIKDCWNWIAGISRGYGQCEYYNKNMRSHRVAYILTKGKIPEELQVQHLCNNPLCCNPNHLELGNQSKNMQYKIKYNRYNQSGENNNSSKLSDDQVREIHKLYKELRHQHHGRFPIMKLIAEKFDISEGHVSYTINGKLWSHIYKEFHK